ncbi:MAG: HAD family phosphatase [Planctomycetota bacterium]
MESPASIEPDESMSQNSHACLMKPMEAIIFDWGGVLIDDPAPKLMQFCAEALEVPVADYIKTHRKFEADFQKGSIPEAAFWARVCGELKVPCPTIDSLWTKAIRTAYSPKEDMFLLASSLRSKGYKIAILSNTEMPVSQYCCQLLPRDMFDAIILSCNEGTRKPERKIYELAMERLQAQPQQTIFIDDRADYIDGAKNVGINTILFENTQQLKDELSRLLAKTS